MIAIAMTHVSPETREEAVLVLEALRTISDEAPTHRETCEAIAEGLERRIAGRSWSFLVSTRIYLRIEEKLQKHEGLKTTQL